MVWALGLSKSSKGGSQRNRRRKNKGSLVGHLKRRESSGMHLTGEMTGSRRAAIGDESCRAWT